MGKRNKKVAVIKSIGIKEIFNLIRKLKPEEIVLMEEKLSEWRNNKKIMEGFKEIQNLKGLLNEILEKFGGEPKEAESPEAKKAYKLRDELLRKTEELWEKVIVLFPDNIKNIIKGLSEVDNNLRNEIKNEKIKAGKSEKKAGEFGSSEVQNKWKDLLRNEVEIQKDDLDSVCSKLTYLKNIVLQDYMSLAGGDRFTVIFILDDSITEVFSKDEIFEVNEEVNKKIDELKKEQIAIENKYKDAIENKENEKDKRDLRVKETDELRKIAVEQNRLLEQKQKPYTGSFERLKNEIISIKNPLIRPMREKISSINSDAEEVVRGMEGISKGNQDVVDEFRDKLGGLLKIIKTEEVEFNKIANNIGNLNRQIAELESFIRGEDKTHVTKIKIQKLLKITGGTIEDVLEEAKEQLVVNFNNYNQQLYRLKISIESSSALIRKINKILGDQALRKENVEIEKNISVNELQNNSEILRVEINNDIEKLIVLQGEFEKWKNGILSNKPDFNEISKLLKKINQSLNEVAKVKNKEGKQEKRVNKAFRYIVNDYLESIPEYFIDRNKYEGIQPVTKSIASIKRDDVVKDKDVELIKIDKETKGKIKQLKSEIERLKNSENMGVEDVELINEKIKENLTDIKESLIRMKEKVVKLSDESEKSYYLSEISRMEKGVDRLEAAVELYNKNNVKIDDEMVDLEAKQVDQGTLEKEKAKGESIIIHSENEEIDARENTIELNVVEAQKQKKIVDASEKSEILKKLMPKAQLNMLIRKLISEVEKDKKELLSKLNLVVDNYNEIDIKEFETIRQKIDNNLYKLALLKNPYNPGSEYKDRYIEFERKYKEWIDAENILKHSQPVSEEQIGGLGDISLDQILADFGLDKKIDSQSSPENKLVVSGDSFQPEVPNQEGIPREDNPKLDEYDDEIIERKFSEYIMKDLDPFKFLSVEYRADLTNKEIDSAYKKMARKLHPDKNADNPKAKELFQQLAEVSKDLKNPILRSKLGKIFYPNAFKLQSGSEEWLNKIESVMALGEAIYNESADVKLEKLNVFFNQINDVMDALPRSDLDEQVRNKLFSLMANLKDRVIMKMSGQVAQMPAPGQEGKVNYEVGVGFGDLDKIIAGEDVSKLDEAQLINKLNRLIQHGEDLLSNKISDFDAYNKEFSSLEAGWYGLASKSIELEQLIGKAKEQNGAIFSKKLSSLDANDVKFDGEKDSLEEESVLDFDVSLGLSEMNKEADNKAALEIDNMFSLFELHMDSFDKSIKNASGLSDRGLESLLEEHKDLIASVDSLIKQIYQSYTSNYAGINAVTIPQDVKDKLAKLENLFKLACEFEFNGQKVNFLEAEISDVYNLIRPKMEVKPEGLDEKKKAIPSSVPLAPKTAKELERERKRKIGLRNPEKGRKLREQYKKKIKLDIVKGFETKVSNFKNIKHNLEQTIQEIQSLELFRDPSRVAIQEGLESHYYLLYDQFVAKVEEIKSAYSQLTTKETEAIGDQGGLIQIMEEVSRFNDRPKVVLLNAVKSNSELADLRDSINKYIKAHEETYRKDQIKSILDEISGLEKEVKTNINLGSWDRNTNLRLEAVKARFMKESKLGATPFMPAGARLSDELSSLVAKLDEARRIYNGDESLLLKGSKGPVAANAYKSALKEVDDYLKKHKKTFNHILDTELKKKIELIDKKFKEANDILGEGRSILSANEESIQQCIQNNVKKLRSEGVILRSLVAQGNARSPDVALENARLNLTKLMGSGKLFTSHGEVSLLPFDPVKFNKYATDIVDILSHYKRALITANAYLDRIGSDPVSPKLKVLRKNLIEEKLKISLLSSNKSITALSSDDFLDQLREKWFAEQNKSAFDDRMRKYSCSELISAAKNTNNLYLAGTQERPGLLKNQFFEHGQGGFEQLKYEIIRGQLINGLYFMAFNASEFNSMKDNPKQLSDVCNDFGKMTEVEIVEGLKESLGVDDRAAQAIISATSQGPLSIFTQTLNFSVFDAGYHAVQPPASDRKINVFKRPDGSVGCEVNVYGMNMLNSSMEVIGRTGPAKAVFTLAQKDGKFGYQLDYIATNDPLIANAMKGKVYTEEEVLQLVQKPKAASHSVADHAKPHVSSTSSSLFHAAPSSTVAKAPSAVDKVDHSSHSVSPSSSSSIAFKSAKRDANGIVYYGDDAGLEKRDIAVQTLQEKLGLDVSAGLNGAVESKNKTTPAFKDDQARWIVQELKDLKRGEVIRTGIVQTVNKENCRSDFYGDLTQFKKVPRKKESHGFFPRCDIPGLPVMQWAMAAVGDQKAISNLPMTIVQGTMDKVCVEALIIAAKAQNCEIRHSSNVRVTTEQVEFFKKTWEREWKEKFTYGEIAVEKHVSKKDRLGPSAK